MKLWEFLIYFSSLFLVACSSAKINQDPNIADHFRNVQGTFVLLDAQTGKTLRHDVSRACTPFSPASTFKIPNTLIALETGVASGEEFELKWDQRAVPRQMWWPSTWARDHRLKTALPNSVVWYYQELARRIGAARMQSYLDRLDYGNRDISGGIDRFWLNGGLKISANEQIDFLRRFYHEELPGISKRSIDIAKKLLVIEETPEYRIVGKTGWSGFGTSENQIGWFVGYLEREGKVYFFATNIDIKKPEDGKARLSITKAVFRELHLINGDPRPDEPM